MKRYSVAEARHRFAELLTVAESGEKVVIERRGVQFTLVANRPAPGKGRRNLVTELHPAVEAGQFTWEPGPHGFAFSPRDGER